VFASPFVGDNICQIEWRIDVTPFFLSSPGLSSPCLELFEITACSDYIARLRKAADVSLQTTSKDIISRRIWDIEREGHSVAVRHESW
jgi:hypothetical protein